MPIRVAQYLADFLVQQGVRHVFMLTGGGAMFLNDALGHHPQLQTVCTHHEQAAAMAAEAHARITGQPAVVNVTTGPGGINALNGVFGAWTDSVPLLVISGQVKRETLMASYPELPLRQLGDQEVDIVAMARSVTKYCASVDRPEDIAWHLDQAWHLARQDRPGPCWLDIPIDVQSAWIEPETLRRFTPPVATPPADLENGLDQLMAKLASARRPVVLAGTGVRAAQALPEFEAVIRRLGIPVTTAWTHDLIASDDPLFCGRPGTIGTRAGNFTVQNADLVLILGSRLNIRQTSYNWQAFAPRAFTIQVDVDPAELAKPTWKPDLPLCADLKPFLGALQQRLAKADHDPEQHREWLHWCRQRLEAYPGVSPQQRQYRDAINPYHFIDCLFEQLEADDIVACGNATACIVPFQVGRLQAGQRLFSNSGSASMGYDLPAAIGAYYGALAQRGEQRRVICLAGDGSLQLNIQELQTVAHHQIPVKIFVLDNRGYLSIRSSQKNFFGRLVGEGPDNGVSFPDFVAVATAYGLPASRLNQAEFATELQQILAAPGPYLCQVVLDPEQGFEPRMSSRQLPDGRIVTPPLEDMYPFLERDELAKNMLDSTAL